MAYPRDTQLYYVLVNCFPASYPAIMRGVRYFYTCFVKESDFFKSQGGLKEEWGKRWFPIMAETIEDARLYAVREYRRIYGQTKKFTISGTFLGDLD